MENFASVLSHDLRTPLYTAQTYTGVLRENGNAEEPVIAEIEQAFDRADTLIDDVLTLAREGTSVTEPTPVDLAAVAEDAWESIQTRSATLSVDVECVVTADKSQLTRLFENLFRNAVEHGDNNVTVHVNQLVDRGFYIADNGPGIPAEKRDQVFEWAYSTKSDGTGFGLAIVQQIADAHGWDVVVTESRDGGARFEIQNVDIGQ